ncbi:MAG TPA: acylneuraminate cytidylyltransferase family protein, partial [Pirellulales bacterium]|nr:acylneuraminate cytidylyltransferase family protein [Pirellulales bacterium]
MKVLGIIPARAGSKRVPQKNLRLLGGKPLVEWAIEAAICSPSINRLVVSSDDAEILKIARVYCEVTPIRRPAKLSTDASPAIDYVRHSLKKVESERPDRFDAIAIVQPSSPLTISDDIDGTIELLETSGADTAVSIVEVAHDLHPAKFKIMQGDRLLPYYEQEQGRMAAHELPKVYVRNCSVYATRRYVIEQGRIIGDDCRGHVMPRERSIDINDELDLAFAEFLQSRAGTGAVR